MKTEDVLVWLEYDVPEGCDKTYAAIAAKLRAAEELVKYCEQWLPHNRPLIQEVENYRAAGKE